RLADGPRARRRPARDGGVVPGQPGLVGAHQVGRVPRLLRAPVRRAPLLTRDRGAKREGESVRMVRRSAVLSLVLLALLGGAAGARVQQAPAPVTSFVFVG